MARMIGKTQWHQGCRGGCCVGFVPKKSAKATEKAQWVTEADEEMSHPVSGHCDNPYECTECGYHDKNDVG